MRAFLGESDIEFMMDLGQSPRAGSLRYVVIEVVSVVVLLF